MVRAFLVSFLAQQLVTHKRERMAERYPHHWLVWEPGSWAAAASNLAETMLPTRRGERPRSGDALAFELAAPRPDVSLRVGRSEACDIVLNDATVSQEHLLLRLEGNRWQVSVSAASRETARNGARLMPGARERLSSGDWLALGGVRLSYLDAQAFLTRLEQEGARF
jgi:hypothetical protein